MQDQVRVIKGVSKSSQIWDAFKGCVIFSIIIMAASYGITFFGYPFNRIGMVILLLTIPIAFLIWVYHITKIRKTNYDYVIDFEGGFFECYIGSYKRETIPLQSIEKVYVGQDTSKWKGSDGKTVYSVYYYLNITGSFGATQLNFSSKLKRDELRGALSEAMRRVKKGSR